MVCGRIDLTWFRLQKNRLIVACGFAINMYHGHYTRWNPLPALEGKRMFCEAVHDNWEGFRIWLRPDAGGQVLVVSFGTVEFYAYGNTSPALFAIVASRLPSLEHVFWTVEDSALTAESHRQSCGTTDDLKLTHFAFLSASDCVDVLAVEPATFRGL
jgi:hypothetical protein